MATITTSGQDFQIRNITVNSTTDTPIDFSQKVVTALIRCRTAVDLYVRHNDNDADYFTIPSGTTLTLDIARGDNDSCWVRSSSGSVVVEVIGGF